MRNWFVAAVLAAFALPGLYALHSVLSSPDLVVQGIYFSDPSPHVGDTFTAYVSTGNVGDAFSGWSQTFFANQFGQLGVFHIIPLVPGQNATNSTQFTCNQTGTVYFWANADYYNWVNESN
ncbi:MAG: CARDB domain-containing protein, partial [Candidatus Micrarchaeota archaeon]